MGVLQVSDKKVINMLKKYKNASSMEHFDWKNPSVSMQDFGLNLFLFIFNSKEAYSRHEERKNTCDVHYH